MQGDVQTFALLLSAYDHGHGLRGRGRYHGWAYLYSRRYRVAVCSALLETPGGDSIAILTSHSNPKSNNVSPSDGHY